MSSIAKSPVSPESDSISEQKKSRFPGSVFFIVGTEAAERFSFYGMRSILTLYIVYELMRAWSASGADGLRDAEDYATTVGHLFNMGVYFMPLLGAWIADKFWGRYWTIIVMSLFYVFGNAVLALTIGSEAGLAIGLALIAFGSGGIKPCVSSFMGEQFSKDQSRFIARAFGMFYWAINFGSFFAFLLIPVLKDSFGYAWAFGIPGITMGLATLVFVAGSAAYKRNLGEWINEPASLTIKRVFSSSALYGAVPAWFFCALIMLTDPEILGTWIDSQGIICQSLFVAGAGVGAFFAVLVLFAIAAFLPRFLISLAQRAHPEKALPAATACVSGKKDDTAPSMTMGERFRAIRGILLLFAVIPVFWALFDQMATTWVILGGQMTATSLFGYPINTETMQNINPIFVMSLIPILSFFIYPTLNRTRFFKTTPLRRMTVGMVLAAFSFVICGWLQNSVDASLAAGTPTISVWWMALPYLVLTLGEVLFSATGLEFAFSQAPASMRSTITSLWNLTTTVGNFLVVIVVALTVNYTDAERFYFFAALMLAVAVVFGIFSAFYKYKSLDE